MISRQKTWLLLLAGVTAGLLVGLGAAPGLKGIWADVRLAEVAGPERTAEVIGPEPPVAETVPERPAEILAAAVSALAGGGRADLGRLFGDRAVLERFRSTVAHGLPSGGVARVARSDDLNAGAENGHRVPVEIWVENGLEAAALAGEISFTRDGGGFRISAVQLEPVPLAVTSWQQAAAVAGTPGAIPRPVPFLGHFRLRDGERRLAVDARTGQVEDE